MTQPFNIANWISDRAKLQPDQPAIIVPKGDTDRRLSFVETEAMINAYARGLSSVGLKAGDRVSLFVKPCLEFMPLTFALYKVGAVVVLIDPGMGKDGLLSCIERIKPSALVGIPKAMFASWVYRKKFASVKTKITVGGGSWLWGGYRLDRIKSKDESPFPSAKTAKSDEASILFTSGSTGPAKGVRYTHGVFDAQTDHIQSMYGIQAGEIDLPCFPLFGLFSLAMGMTVVIPEMDPTKPAKADPKTLVKTIKKYGVTNAFASPALWKPFARYCISQDIQLPTLNRILSAGAPIPPALHADFQHILKEGSEVHTPYGATESLPVASIGSMEVLTETGRLTDTGKGTCVGTLAPNMAVKIIEITDEPIENWSQASELPHGQIGEICVFGPVVTTEYKEEPQQTKQAKIKSETGEIWHRMGDIGYFDDRGRLWFCGRKSHRVQTATGVLYPVPCEAVFNTHEDVARSALVGVDHMPIIVIERTDSRVDKSKLTEALADIAKQNPLTKDIDTFLFHDSFPVDVRHNAKIHRLQLRDWAANNLKGR